MDNPSSLPLAITMGEPAGIGGEIILKAWASHHDSLPPFFIIDDLQRLQKIAAKLDIRTPVYAYDEQADIQELFIKGLPVINTPLPSHQKPGILNPANASAVIHSITKAVELTQTRKASGLVTNPIQKSALYGAGFSHPGHTEYLASLCDPYPLPVMMLACDQLRVVPVTIHVSLKDALDALTTEMIVEKTRITAEALRMDFGIQNPHLAIAGLNPHAGEGGAMGTEEQRIIQPAIDILKNDGLTVSGPYPPDTLFSAQARTTYDAAICMYHDQALIPIKTLDFDGGVNVTLGLPFIRTSPDHGTALDIAGTGKASPRSLIAAIKMAADLSKNRLAFDHG